MARRLLPSGVVGWTAEHAAAPPGPAAARGSDLSGTVLAQTAITVSDGATVTGRLFARTAEVTLISNTITKPSCTATPAPTSQVAAVPAGPVSAGDGSTVARTSTAGYAAIGALAVAGLGGAAVVAVRRRRLDA